MLFNVYPYRLSGDISSLWDPTLYKITKSIKGINVLSIKCLWLHLNKLCCFVNVYASQDPSRKKVIWNNLQDLLNSYPTCYWFVFGDFNVVLLYEERLGFLFFPIIFHHFNKFIHSSRLMEIKIGGYHFNYLSL